MLIAEVGDPVLNYTKPAAPGGANQGEDTVFRVSEQNTKRVYTMNNASHSFFTGKQNQQPSQHLREILGSLIKCHFLIYSVDALLKIKSSV